MLITLEEARHEPVTWEEVVELDLDELEISELASLSPVSCTGTVGPARDGFLVRAHLMYTQGLMCTRCLEASEDEVSSDFELLVQVGDGSDEPFASDAEIELAEEDLDTITIEGETLDTVPLIIEQLQLGIPMKPLCSSDCRGLCGICGANLNHGPCDCAEPVDPRWTGLEALKARLESGSEEGPKS